MKWVNEHMFRLLRTRQLQRWIAGLAILSGLAQVAQAENAIVSVDAAQQGQSTLVTVTMRDPIEVKPTAFSTASPARIAIDFVGATNATGKTAQDLNAGAVRNVIVAQSEDRARLLLNLKHQASFATAVNNKQFTVTINGDGSVASALDSSGMPAAVAPGAAMNVTASMVAGRPALRNIDFRRGTAGEGRIIVDLPPNQVAVDVQQQGQLIVVNFKRAGLPENLRRRLDVGDFGTPVRSITTTTQGDNVRMVIQPSGLWEQTAYQTDSQMVIDVRPVKEEPNKLTVGTQGYRGDKLSLNFQNIEVRSVLQVIADFTGLNIITSDTVGGTLTLRLKDVPWDQALDIVMQAKGLDMRKNGSVLWIAPKDELLTKEKLELEQRALISDLEPVRTESFQLNYQKAAEFRNVFGINEDGTRRTTSGTTTQDQNSILSKRGSVVIDIRTNQLFITDTVAVLDKVRELVRRVDIPSRQVLIEARMVEASDTFSRNLGVKLGANFTTGKFSTSGQQTAATTSNTYPTLSGNSVSLPAGTIGDSTPASIGMLFGSSASKFISLELSALEADGQGKVISSPRVVTADQQKALIEQGTEIPYQQSTSSGATSVEFKKANLKLEVTPQITPDGNVILAVDVTNDSVGQTLSTGVAINTKHINTRVQVENGGTVMIGGIYTQTISDATNKVPLLGDIPVLGYLFKNNAKVNNKTELLIFLTPKILLDREAPGQSITTSTN